MFPKFLTLFLIWRYGLIDATDFVYVPMREKLLTAVDDCAANGKRLVTIDSESKFLELTDFLDTREPERIWIGLRSQSSGSPFVFLDGSVCNFFMWDLGEPDIGQDKNCVVLDKSPYMYRTEKCHDREDYVCEDIPVHAESTTWQNSQSTQIALVTETAFETTSLSTTAVEVDTTTVRDCGTSIDTTVLTTGESTVNHTQTTEGNIQHHNQTTVGNIVHHNQTTGESTVHHTQTTEGNIVHHNQTTVGNIVHHNQTTGESTVNHTLTTEENIKHHNQTTVGNIVHHNQTTGESTVHHTQTTTSGGNLKHNVVTTETTLAESDSFAATSTESHSVPNTSVTATTRMFLDSRTVTNHSHHLTSGTVHFILPETSSSEPPDTVTGLSEPLAGCICTCVTSQSPFTAEDLDGYIESTKQRLAVDVDTLSSKKRKKISADDTRTSSTYMGYLSIIIISSIFGSLILIDLTNVYITSLSYFFKSPKKEKGKKTNV